MKFLDRLSDAYYSGNPLVSNEVFDELAKQHNYQGIGTSSETDIRHINPMWSLQKVYPEDTPPFEGGIKTDKLDGAAVEVTYREGKLVWGATRGDGKTGKDITDKMSLLVPTEIKREDTIQIVGEVVTSLGKDNIRNYASGALNLKDLEEFRSRELYFFAYDASPTSIETYKGVIHLLSGLGFRTVVDATAANLMKPTWPTDGKVVRLHSNEEYYKAGFTSKHPRGAYALKENKEGVETKLLDITWQVGRSGVVSPVAILEPVDVDGAIVSRATLHNWAYIQSLGLEKDCRVKIIRAGEIIPRVVEKVND